MTDCIVVGGGIIGMLTARMLHERGVDVTLVERGEVGRESSWAGGGILSPLYPWRYPEAITRLARMTQETYPAVAQALLDETGVDAEWLQSGLLILDQDERDTAVAWAAVEHQPIQLLKGDGLRAIEPALAPTHTTGLWMPEVAQIRNPRLLKALHRSLQLRGIAIREHTDVTSIRRENGRAAGVETPAGPILAERVIVAGGAWSGPLFPMQGGALPVAPVRGQMILFRAEPGVVQRVTLWRERYVIPRKDGRVLAGSTLEYVGFEKNATDEAVESLRQAAFEVIPALERFPVEQHWAGLRPGSPDGIPYIGAHPTIPGLFINAGHFRNGLVMSLASAQLGTELVLGETPCLDPAPYSPLRFRAG
ncbi:MAG: glycine oxidase ThiO [Chromatiales bacterium]|nr:glycine oxidase ThiO [Chromatiales bacterium]